MANFEKMVWTGNGHLQIKNFSNGLVKSVEDKEVNTSKVNQEIFALANFTRTVQRLAKQVEKLSSQKPTTQNN